jgi:anti-sigma B factor antagonist
MDGPERVVIARDRDGAIVVEGELDADSAHVLDEAIEAVAIPGTSIILDMAAVTFVDSTALNVLVSHRGRLEQHGQHLDLRNPSAIVSRVLEMSGLDDYFRVIEQ